MKKVTGKPRFSLFPHREKWNILALRLKHVFSANQCNRETAQQTQSPVDAESSYDLHV